MRRPDDRALPGAGIVAAVLYTAMILFVGLLWVDYSTASRVDANLPTPGVGVWERMSAAACMVWIAGLAMVLRGRVNASR